jgi:hypothetical protein
VIALGYGLDDRGSRVRFPAAVENFSFQHRVQNSSGAQPASYPMGTRGSFPGGKSDHSPPSSAEVQNVWSYTSTPQYIFMAWCLVKHRDNFTLPQILTWLQNYLSNGDCTLKTSTSCGGEDPRALNISIRREWVADSLSDHFGHRGQRPRYLFDNTLYCPSIQSECIGVRKRNLKGKCKGKVVPVLK